MSNEVKLDGNIFGYDTLVEEGRTFTALKGSGEPDLYIGMTAALLGDSRGYVPSGFRPGEDVTITGFTEAFKKGSSDHIIQVSNGTRTGWVKPSNIQRNVLQPDVQLSSTDAVHRRVRQAVHIAMAELMDSIYVRKSETERKTLPRDVGPYVNAMVSYALKRLP